MPLIFHASNSGEGPLRRGLVAGVVGGGGGVGGAEKV